MSEWVSEEVWRSALAMVQDEIGKAEQPGFVLYHRGVLDITFTASHRAKLLRKFDRIKSAGHADWKERLDA